VLTARVENRHLMAGNLMADMGYKDWVERFEAVCPPLSASPATPITGTSKEQRPFPDNPSSTFGALLLQELHVNGSSDIQLQKSHIGIRI
jgi:hypothetical protein